MTWQVRAFLDEHGIKYSEGGKSSKRGNIYIRCPFCGDPDEKKMLLGISLATGYWGCWKNSGHRGKAPHRLIRILLGWSDSQISEYLGTLSAPAGTLGDLRKRLGSLEKRDPIQKEVEVTLPEDCAPISSRPYRRPFWDYLVRRGFREEDIPALIADWDLRCALVGIARGRIIIPLRWRGALYGWTGRAIGKTDLRYFSMPEGDAVKRHPLCGPEIERGGKILCVVEGPIDVMKFDFYARPFGVRAAGLLGLTPTPAQALDLVHLSSSFAQTRILVDANSGGAGLRVAADLAMLAPRLAELPGAVKDPGDLTPSQVRDLARRLLSQA